LLQVPDCPTTAGVHLQLCPVFLTCLACILQAQFTGTKETKCLLPQTLQWWDMQIQLLADRAFSSKRVRQLELQLQDTERRLSEAQHTLTQPTESDGECTLMLLASCQYQTSDMPLRMASALPVVCEVFVDSTKC
jgi:hypothetical protein